MDLNPGSSGGILEQFEMTRLIIDTYLGSLTNSQGPFCRSPHIETYWWAPESLFTQQNSSTPMLESGCLHEREPLIQAESVLALEF